METALHLAAVLQLVHTVPSALSLGQTVLPEEGLRSDHSDHCDHAKRVAPLISWGSIDCAVLEGCPSPST